jgi:hypothetical protein
MINEQDHQQGANDNPATGPSCPPCGRDELAYRIEGDHVILTKARRDPIDDSFATFREWSSEADQRAYGDL